MPFDPGKEPKLVRLAVEPAQRVIPRNGRQQLRVTAHYDDGTSTDVTRLAQYQSNAADLADVDGQGRGRGPRRRGRGGDHGPVRRAGRRSRGRRSRSRAEPPKWDEPASSQPRSTRSSSASSASWASRRAGPAPTPSSPGGRRSTSAASCPSPAEVAAFEKDADPEKRAKWVDRLLDRPEYADLFAMKWSAILKNKRALGDVSQPGTFAFHGWIRQSLAENKPYDQFVAEIVAARGDAERQPGRSSGIARSNTLEDRVDDTAQLFLGLRIQCARCHHHPFEQLEPGRLLRLRLALHPDRQQGRDRPDHPADLTLLAEGQATNP